MIRTKMSTRRQLLCVVLLLSVGMWFVHRVYASAQSCSTFGLVTYCASTSLATINISAAPTTLTGLIGSGSVATVTNDINPSETYIRVTDNATCNGGKSWFAAGAGGSADVSSWNSDSTMMAIESSSGGYVIMGFNPSTLAVSNLYNCGTAPNGGEWSANNRSLYYYIPKANTWINQLDFTTTTPPTFPKPTTVVNFASGGNCLPISYPQTSNDWSDMGGVSADGTIYSAAFSSSGGQGTGVDVVVYKSGSGGGCIHLNTNTGAITGDWGTSGTWSIAGTSATIHNVKMAKNGSWLVIVTSSCTPACGAPIFWKIGTTTAVIASASSNGHWTEGNATWANNDNTPLMNMRVRSFSNPSSTTQLVTSYPPGAPGSGVDQHPSWNNVDANDSYPIFTQNFCATSGAGVCSSLPTNYVSGWVAEVLGYEQSGPVLRFGHTFNSSVSNGANFSVYEGIGTVSQDGRWFLFTSDMMGTLGSTGGGASCMLTSNCRGDAFILKLASDGPTPATPTNLSVTVQ